MRTAHGTGSPSDASEARRFPAYGPIEGLLSYVLFYVVVDRATPTVVAVVTDVMLGVSPSLVGLGLAAFLWFVLVVTAVDQGGRQLVALGVVRGDAGGRTIWSYVIPPEASTVASLVVLVVAGALAWWTFDRAIVTAVEVVRWIAALDVGAFVSYEFLVMGVFFVAFGLVTNALDRLIVDGLRAAFAD